MAITGFDYRSCGNFTTARNGYVVVSYFLLAFLSSLLFSDFLHAFVLEDSAKTSQDLSMAVLCTHTFSFFFAILGFVYTTQTAGNTVQAARRGLGAILGNLLVFILRVAFELGGSGFREEYYRLSKSS